MLLMKVSLSHLLSFYAHILTEEIIIDDWMVAMDEVSGILDHSDGCKHQVEMECNPRLLLHQEL
jgi:hypothetical protein